MDLAAELNQAIKDNNPVILELLSEKGKNIFFPEKGILAQTADAKGKDINATIGIALEEDGSPMRLGSIADNINLDPRGIFPYAPSFGKPELREIWKEMIYKKNPTLEGKEISLPVVTNALTHGLSMMGYLFVDPGDKMIIPDMFWGNYKMIFVNGHEAVIDNFNTFKEGGFDVDALKVKLEENGVGKKILVLNFPNNPSGYTPTEEEAKQIIAVLKGSAEAGNKLVVLCDDAYFGLVYEDGVYEESLFAELADLHENVVAVKIDGATKEDYVWGFRVGFVTYGIKGATPEVYEALAAKTSGAVRGNISNAPHISQALVLKSFTNPKYGEEKKEKYELLKKRANLVKKILADHEEYKECFEALPFNSGYFMCIKLKDIDAEQARQILLEKYSTGVISIDDMLRIAFSAVPSDKLEKLFENIYKACKEV